MLHKDRKIFTREAIDVLKDLKVFIEKYIVLHKRLIAVLITA